MAHVELSKVNERKVGHFDKGQYVDSYQAYNDEYDDDHLILEKEDKESVPFLHGQPASKIDFDAKRRKAYRVKLALHMVSCFMSSVHMLAFSTYLFFKSYIIFRHFGEVLASPWLLLIWILEFAYFFSSLVTAMDNALPPSNRPSLYFDGEYYPTVDIMLPCCKEPTDVPVESLRAALKLDYPRDRFRVLVLDDGGDNALRAICQSLQEEWGGQLVYLRRTKIPGVPHHFKCGNLNYGLEHSTAEYVVMMDADMILHPTFLRKVLPHIVSSPNISFVQIPQSYYNLPIGDPLSDSSTMGYDKVLIHRDTLGCATCIGTGALFRRKHLNVIGGFQPQSITEDTTTAYALFREGYRSAYINEKLQVGLTPWTFEGYIKQRCRWGQGAMQQLNSTWREMLGRNSKLNIVLKLLYFWHSGYYFLSFVNMTLIVTFVHALLFRWHLTVGTKEENREFLVYLAYNLISWRLYWYCTWLSLPLPIQSRNRDESHFWWMTPFFMKMIIESLFDYDATFKFVPTSNIDRNVANTEKSPWMQGLGKLKHVRFHLVYTFIIVSVVASRLFTLPIYYRSDCVEIFYVSSISLFLLHTCAHMMLPVFFILWPTSFSPKDRRSLLTYDADGVPVFDPRDLAPKWAWTVMFYELFNFGTLVYWVFVAWMLKTRADEKWCVWSQGAV